MSLLVRREEGSNGSGVFSDTRVDSAVQFGARLTIKAMASCQIDFKKELKRVKR
jgi:hypothetical protein